MGGGGVSGSRIILGEVIGTFLLMAIGCGAGVVATAVGGVPLVVIAFAWGLAVTVAVYASRGLSDAHLNPVFTLAFVVLGRTRRDAVPAYLLGQFIGAFAGTVAVYALAAPEIASFEAVNGIVRGTAASVRTAALFTVFFPSPGGVATLTALGAFATEAAATLTLVALVLILTDPRSPARTPDWIAPCLVGVVVACLIGLAAPLTGAGFNPAREAAPRLFTFLSGWGRVALAGGGAGGFFVYWLGPIVGAMIAAYGFRRALRLRTI